MTYKIHYIEQSGPPARVQYGGFWYYATGRRAQGGDGENNFAIWEYRVDGDSGYAMMNWNLPDTLWADLKGEVVSVK